MQDTPQHPSGSLAASLFPPPALSRRATPDGSPSVRVVEAHPFRIGPARFARVTLDVEAPGGFSLRLRVLASGRRVTLPSCGAEEGVLFADPALAAAVEEAARAAAIEANGRNRAPLELGKTRDSDPDPGSREARGGRR